MHRHNSLFDLKQSHVSSSFAVLQDRTSSVSWKQTCLLPTSARRGHKHVIFTRMEQVIFQHCWGSYLCNPNFRHLSCKTLLLSGERLWLCVANITSSFSALRKEAFVQILLNRCKFGHKLFPLLCWRVSFSLIVNEGFVMDPDNCARCQCLSPCDWHMAAHVTQTVWWWSQRNRDTDVTPRRTQRWMAALISSSDRWILWLSEEPHTQRCWFLGNQFKVNSSCVLKSLTSGSSTGEFRQVTQVSLNWEMCHGKEQGHIHTM